MISKKKICSNCNSEQYIWKNKDGNRYCQKCWNIIRQKTVPIIKIKYKPIKQISAKRIAENKVYTDKRKIYLDTHPTCEANIPYICSFEAIDIHHLYSGASRSKYFLNDLTWKAVCRNCHQYIHTVLTKDEAINLGLKLIE